MACQNCQNTDIRLRRNMWFRKFWVFYKWFW